MIRKIVNILKPWVGAIMIVLILQFTGLLGSISFVAQSAMLKTGLVNATAEADRNPTPFDYSFMIKTLDGERVDFTEYKDKVIFLNLWATWCGPCRAEMPTIQALYEKIGDNEEIAFVILSVDRDKDLPKVEKYVTDRKFSFPVFLPSGYLTEQLQVPNIPTTFIISKKGEILVKEVGTTNFDTNRFRKFLLNQTNND